MANVLIIDDDTSVCHMIGSIARAEGHHAIAVHCLAEGMQCLSDEAFDCVFLDVFLPDGNGLDRIGDIAAGPSSPEIIIITGYGDPDGAELAITNGAWSYIEKSATLDQYSLALNQVVKYRRRREAIRPLELRSEGLIGESPAMGKVRTAVAQVAASKANVLILGETGTGKEVVARAIHANSPQARSRFVAVDCAAMPKALVESILFGHAQGAFTGATTAEVGLVKLADGGTLFLDEVGEMPPSMQKTFLRVLQERRYRPIGSRHEETSNFRLIAATNRDLDAMCAEGSFRLDFLYRLKTFEIRTPPLRERREDLSPLALFHIAKLCDANAMPLKGLAQEVLEVFERLDWPGNVRELVNTLERMCVATEGPVLHLEHLPLELRALAARQSLLRQDGPLRVPPLSEDTPPSMVPEAGVFSTFKEHRRRAIERADRDYLVCLLERSGGSIKRACEMAGLSRTRIYCLMQEYGISKKFI